MIKKYTEENNSGLEFMDISTFPLESLVWIFFRNCFMFCKQLCTTQNLKDDTFCWPKKFCTFLLNKWVKSEITFPNNFYHFTEEQKISKGYTPDCTIPNNSLPKVFKKTSLFPGKAENHINSSPLCAQHANNIYQTLLFVLIMSIMSIIWSVSSVQSPCFQRSRCTSWTLCSNSRLSLMSKYDWVRKCIDNHIKILVS